MEKLLAEAESAPIPSISDKGLIVDAAVTTWKWYPAYRREAFYTWQAKDWLCKGWVDLMRDWQPALHREIWKTVTSMTEEQKYSEQLAMLLEDRHQQKQKLKVYI